MTSLLCIVPLRTTAQVFIDLGFAQHFHFYHRTINRLFVTQRNLKVVSLFTVGENNSMPLGSNLSQLSPPPASM